MRIIRITFVALGLLITALLALGWRCYDLQQLKSHQYADRFASQRLLRTSKYPQRGAILDSRGRVLAASNSSKVIFADSVIITDANDTAKKLASIVNIHTSDIFESIIHADALRPRILADANEWQCSQARKIYGIGVESRWVRYYPTGRLMANIIGFVSPPPFSRGLEGIEFQYDDKLSGTPACNVFYKDVHRRPIRPKEINGSPVDGYGLVLTIDATIQKFVRDELVKQYEAYEAESAVAVVAVPQTGEILAMVSLPDFDPADVCRTDPNLFVSGAVIDGFEPGSIIKPVVMAIAMDAGEVRKRETIFCENGTYGGRGSGFGTIHEYRKPFGDLTPKEILINSSNIGMAKIGQRLGAQKLYDGLRMFGFGKTVDIELPCASRALGQLREPEFWTGYSITRVPYGQEISVTAMQLIRAYCILGNGGKLVEPYLVKAIVDSDGKTVKINHPTPPVAYVVKPEIAKWIISDAMAAVVNEGTGKRAKLEKWQVFGKTGTANIYDPAIRTYSDTDYIASFICGAPAENPEIIVLVSIRKPNKKLGNGYTGGVVASPVAAKIIEKTLTYLEKLKI
ncbi:MAG: penicillin-binding protein 2 [Sedimentisphaerales bacterium]|nr:penicillin-binding protein 2 [Sedimentisphaerales bacterium]